jgi:hypothetical protein
MKTGVVVQIGLQALPVICGNHATIGVFAWVKQVAAAEQYRTHVLACHLEAQLINANAMVQASH